MGGDNFFSDTDTNEGETYYEMFAFHPELCTEWETLIDGSLDDTLTLDYSLRINPKTTCVKDTCHPDLPAPDTLCMSKNGIMHSFLEGEYVHTGVVGNKYGTKEYVRSKQLVYNGEAINVYLWFYGEMSPKYDWWIIASHNLSIGLQQNYSYSYGWNPCSIANPVNCHAPWNFYWAGHDNVRGVWHADASFELHEGECATADNSSQTIVYDEAYDYVCIDVPDDALRGGYEIQREGGEDAIPYWRKPSNAYVDHEVYLYFDAFYGYWQVGNNLSVQHMELICMDSSPYPQGCKQWYDVYSNEMNALVLRADGCTANDMLGYGEQTDDGMDLLEIVEIIFFIIIIVAVLTYAGYCIWNRTHKIDESGDPLPDIDVSTDVDDGPGSEMTKRTTKRSKFGSKAKRKRGHEQLMDESDDETPFGDTDALESGMAKPETTMGGYDMSPLHHRDSGSESEDRQENAIDDEEDHLVGTVH